MSMCQSAFGFTRSRQRGVSDCGGGAWSEGGLGGSDHGAAGCDVEPEARSSRLDALRRGSPCHETDLSVSSRRLLHHIPFHESRAMTRQISCTDVVLGCTFHAEAATEQELIDRVARHAAEVHGMTEVTPEVLEKVRAAIRET